MEARCGAMPMRCTGTMEGSGRGFPIDGQQTTKGTTMSYSAIITFDSDGNYKGNYAEFRNSWRGAVLVWRHMVETYLPTLTGYWLGDDDAMRRIGELAGKEGVTIDGEVRPIPLEDRITLLSTFDNVLVRPEELPLVIKAFTLFSAHEGFENSSIKDQIPLLEDLCHDDDVSAIGWMQTSVAGTMWYGYDDKEDYDDEEDCDEGEELRYNWREQAWMHVDEQGGLSYARPAEELHWFLFDDYPELRAILPAAEG